MLTSRRFEIELKKNLKALKKNDVVLACSGGVDSIALLHLLAQMKINSIEVVYIDHGLRSDTQKDIDCIKTLIQNQKNQILFFKYKVSPQIKNSEAALRESRYRILYDHLKKHAKKGYFPALLTAHHQDDVIETLLLKLMRGTHPESVVGIRSIQRFEATSKTPELVLVRPLLSFTKKEIQEYAQKNLLYWNEDTTNQSAQYTRNRVRHELLPLMESIRPGAQKNIGSFFNALQENNAVHINSNLKQLKSKSLTQSLCKEGLLVEKIDHLILKSLVQPLLQENASKTKKSHWNTVEKILEERAQKKTGETKEVKLPGKHSLLFQKNRVFLTKTKI